MTAGNRSGAQAISQNAIDALPFNNAQPNNAGEVQQLDQNALIADGEKRRPAQPGQNWVANGSFALQKPVATPAPGNVEGLGINLYLNDNIVEQRVAADKADTKPRGEASPAKPKAGGKAGQGGDFDSDFAKKLPQAKD